MTKNKVSTSWVLTPSPGYETALPRIMMESREDSGSFQPSTSGLVSLVYNPQANSSCAVGMTAVVEYNDPVSIAMEQLENILDRGIFFFMDLDKTVFVKILQGFKDVFSFPGNHIQVLIPII
jgi:hypothetical protein